MRALDMKYNFQLNQENLHTLCTDRPLMTPEIHKPNDFYGQASVLKQYAGYPNRLPLKAVLEHGLFFDNWMWDIDRIARLPLFFSNSTFRSEIHRRETRKQSIPIGFGYLYAMANLDPIHGVKSDRPIREGTVVFPSHSTHHIKAVYDHAGYATKLKELPDKYKPIIICIYWKDFLYGHHSFYEKEGFKIITAGHIYDTDFLYRFCDICRQFKYSTSNNIGGHLFYSVKSGCRFFYTPSDKINHEVHADVPLGGFTPMYNRINEKSISLFSEPKDEMDRDQLEFVDEYMGSAHFKTPDELRDLFMYAEKKDKSWNMLLLTKNGKFSPLNILPSFWQRSLLYVPKQILGIGSRIKNQCLATMKKLLKNQI
jgi:hypothetical protein